MKIRWLWITVLAAVQVAPLAGQQTCSNGIRIEGTVMDPSGAVVPGATIHSANGEMATADAAGRYELPCIRAGSTTLTAEAQGFAIGRAKASAMPGGVAHVNLQLEIAAVQTDVQVGDDDATAMDADHGATTTTLGTQDVERLADDPDDFQRQLQALAARGGGLPGAATFTVDGFQNSSALPPKSSIASIRINPDMFSPEYERAPYLGGRVEIFTKPGAGAYHGALFFTDSDESFNATDPFSATATPAGKRRYGFELSGPIVKNKGDIALTLEKRDIDEFNIVNAVTLDANGNQVNLQQSIPAPQRLWIASGRSGWQVSPKDTATVSFSANVNNLGNQGIGGLTLPVAGYSSLVNEYDLRFLNTQTLNANLLHETRVGYTWKRTEQNPISTAPALQVAGYFNGGGSTGQNLNNRERDLEVDDDVMFTKGRHTVSIGAQSLGIFVHNYDPNTFNGAFVFGGGSAPTLDANNHPTGQTTTISAIEQYRRALLNLSGGNPTTYQLTTGTPLVPLTQWRLALYAGDAIKLTPNFTVATGLRYQLQTSPGSFGNFAPRLGISWAPDKKRSWVIHLRAGLFHDPNLQGYATEVYRLNGARQQQTTVYSPNFSNPLTPTTGSIQVSTLNQFPRSLAQVSSLQTHIRVEHDFHQGWHAMATLFWAENWGSLRLVNINAPLIASSNNAPPDPLAALLVPRPIAPNENIMQYQNSGHLSGNIFVTGGDRHGKRAAISVYYVHTNLKTDTGSGVTSPQSSYSESGESSRPDGESRNAVYANGHVTLPYEIELSSILDALGGQPYNIISGTDVNGDGNFNDRPSYASTPGAGVYSTKFGLLTTNSVNGNVPRNLGVMPARIHLDANLSRMFTLNPSNKDHPRTLTFNVRSANLLNHTNVTTVGTVVSSSTFSRPLSAETARRLELGVRFAF